MRVYIDLDSRNFIASAGQKTAVTALAFKRGDTVTVDCYFIQDGVVTELATGATGKLGLKAADDFAGDYIVQASSWTKTGTGTSTYYRFAPSFNTNELNDLFVDGTVTDDVADQTARYALTGLSVGNIIRQNDNGTYWEVVNAGSLSSADGWAVADQIGSVSLILEVEWVAGSATTSTNTVTATVSNDLIKGTEGVPTEAAPPYPTAAQVPVWRLDLTSLTGGSASALDSLVTATGTYDNRLVIVYVGSAAKGYLLVSGTDAESSPGVIRPDDYNASTNAKVWKQVF